MARLSPMQLFLMLAGSTSLAAGSVLLPTSAFAAPAPAASTGTVMTAEQGDHGKADATKWVKTTDSPTGITFKLPGEATVEESVGDDISCAGRLYSVDTADESTSLTVNDCPTLAEDLDLQLQFAIRADNEYPSDDLKATDIKKATVDGHAVLDARLTDPDDADWVAFMRIISDDNHLVKIMTAAFAADEQAVSQTQQKARDSVHFPKP
ncbi:hypothetical protein ACFYYN_33385 [Streptomyces sp. NPDC001902]